MFRRIYCIPTNREVKQSLNSYVKEVDFAYKKYSEKFPIIIIETNEGEVENRNKYTIENLKSVYSNIIFIHFTMEKQGKLFSKLFSGNFEYLKNHFLSNTKDYGKVMNKIFLLAALFNVNIFHRRDSDTYLLNDHNENYNGGYPIEIEIDNVGNPLGPIEGSESSENDLITVVGSNYYGEWNMDIKDLAIKDFSLIYKLYELLGFDKSVVKEICDKAFRFEVPPPDDILKLTLVRGVNDNENPDCGNMAMYNVFNEYPMLDARNTLASDYFVMDLATAMGKPSLHHNRVVFHAYSENRFQYGKKLSYWEGVLKFCDYFNIYNQIYNERLVNDNTTHREVVDIVSKFPRESKILRRERMFKIINEILLDFDSNYSKLGNELISGIPELVDELNNEYDRHKKMIRDWPAIMNKCREMKWGEYFDLTAY